MVGLASVAVSVLIIVKNQRINNKAEEMNLLGGFIIASSVSMMVNAVQLFVYTSVDWSLHNLFFLTLTLQITVSCFLIAFWIFTAKFWVLGHMMEHSKTKKDYSRHYRVLLFAGGVYILICFVCQVATFREYEVRKALWVVSCVSEIVICFFLIDGMRRILKVIGLHSKHLNHWALGFLVFGSLVLMSLSIASAARNDPLNNVKSRTLIISLQFALQNSCLLSTLYYLLLRLEK